MPLNDMLMQMAQNALAKWLGIAGNQARGEDFMVVIIDNMVTSAEAVAAAPTA